MFEFILIKQQNSDLEEIFVNFRNIDVIVHNNLEVAPKKTDVFKKIINIIEILNVHADFSSLKIVRKLTKLSGNDVDSLLSTDSYLKNLQ